jgi:hypothetical protein
MQIKLEYKYSKEVRGIAIIIHRRPNDRFARCNTHLTKVFFSAFSASQPFASSKGRRVDKSKSVLLPILLFFRQLKQKVVPPLVHHAPKCTVRSFGAYLSVVMIEPTNTYGAGKCLYILAAGDLVDDDGFLVGF